MGRDRQRLLYQVKKESNVRVPMRDGVELAADLYYPDAAGPFPAVIERTPYNRQESVLLRTETPQYLAARGYLVVVQDVRGRFGSDGVWFPFIADGWGELQDGYDTVEWVARHPLCNGRVGTLGGSFAGQTQMLLAATRPPHLVCCFVREAASDLAQQWVYRGGAFEHAFNLDWNFRHALDSVYKQFGLLRAALDRKPAFYEEGPFLNHQAVADPLAWLRQCLSHPDKDQFYEPFDLEKRYDQYAVPIYHLGGWFDIFLGGTLANFIGIRQRARRAKARRGQRLVVGPWVHGAMMHEPSFGRYVGDMDFGPDAVLDMNAEMLRWFDCWLRGVPNGVDRQAPVRYFLMGANRWCEADGWPPAGARPLRLYLHRGRGRRGPVAAAGRLAPSKPAGSPPPSSYNYDPRHPVPTMGGHTLYSVSTTTDVTGAQVPDLTATAGPRDQRPIEDRCLLFTSEPLSEPLDVVGPLRVILYGSSSAPDTDFVARLTDVFPDGRSMLVADGIIRARYRTSRRRPRLLEAGKVYRFEIDLWSTAWRFEAGHRLRVAITSSCFPRFDCNPNTGGTMAGSAAVRVARNRVYHDAAHPSHIALSVLKAE